MPIEDANDKLFKIINPAGVIAGFQAGIKPMLNYALENPNAETQEIVKLVYELIAKMIKCLHYNHEVGKNTYINEYNDEITNLVVQTTEGKTNDSQPTSK